MENIVDALVDTLKIVPFLYLAFLAVEYFEHNSSEKLILWLEKSKKTQPLIGALAGLLPSCGMPVGATSLFSANIISLGTLIAVYLASSDEAFIYILSTGKIDLLVELLLIKFIVAIIFGYLTHIFLSKHHIKAKIINRQHDDCHENIFVSSFNHAIKIIALIFAVNVLLNFILSTNNLDILSKLLLTDSIFQPVLVSLLGLIPNCTISVLFADLYINSLISFSSLVSALLSTTGASVILLIKSSLKTSVKFKIIGLLLACSMFSGILLSFFTFN